MLCSAVPRCIVVQGPESEDNTYLGYSLALGHFNQDSQLDIAVGMPRGSNLTGKVIFLTGTSMEQLHNLTGNQVRGYSFLIDLKLFLVFIRIGYFGMQFVR